VARAVLDLKDKGGHKDTAEGGQDAISALNPVEK
jgi:hypothetical protein